MEEEYDEYDEILEEIELQVLIQSAIRKYEGHYIIAGR
jgi:hypothetical protein